MPLDPLTPPSGDSAVLFLRWIAGFLWVAGIFIIGISAILLRKREALSVHLRWALFVGMGILPITAIPFTLGVGFESAKEVSACGSCHEMDSHIRDLHDPKSESLAAIHFHNRYIQEHACYTCHTGYGIFGTMKSKMDGLSHLWIHYTGRDSSKPIHMHRPFNFSSCLSCHAGSKKFVEVEEHSDPETVKGLKTGEVTCLECHVAPHTIKEERQP